MKSTVDEIWHCVLDELQSQVNPAMYEAWVKDSRAVGWGEEGQFIVGVHDESVKGWLASRLQALVERTLIGIVAHPVRVTFVVTPPATQEGEDEQDEPPPDDPDDDAIMAVKFFEFDPTRRGFLLMSKYAECFWQPLLGVVAYATYRFLRALDKQNEGWGKWHFVYVDEVAATVAGGNRQAITGVRRRRADGSVYWQPGALDQLSQAGLARVEVLGKGNKTRYRVSCMNSLPLLTPAQVERLPDVLQTRHKDFLRRCSIEYEEWQQLSLPSLVQDA